MKRTKKRWTHGHNILIASIVALISFLLWAFANRPVSEPAWPARIDGFSFSPFRAGQNPQDGRFPSEEEVDADLALLQGKAHAVRTYTVAGVLGEIPRLARKHDLNVFLGGWIGSDEDANEKEIGRLIQIAKENRRNVVRVAVGNEAILRQEATVAEMAGYLDRVRNALHIPVSTAEPWHIWLKYPELAKHVDFLAVHMLPYWEGVHIDGALGHVQQAVERLRAAFPDKPIVFAEVGWPSNGRTRDGAVASPANEATFLRRFIDWVEKAGYVYYVMEAFDQPWKQSFEGAAGAYWGVYDLNRQPKFAFTSDIINLPEWPMLAMGCSLLAMALFLLLLVDGHGIHLTGRFFLAVVSTIAVTAVVWVAFSYFNRYLDMTTLLTGLLLFTGSIGVLVVFLVEAHEWVEARWIHRWRRQFTAPPVKSDARPRVSIHVAAYNEPPDMLRQTLNALARLDYPDYEVVVVDNNTRDPAVWRPIEAHCRQLGERFRFFHVDPLAGYKAGALNFALKHTDPAAEIVAVIDADYVVDRDWLQDMVPYFARPDVAIVQSPQDYHDGEQGLFKSMIFSEYKGFFHIGMMTRNERNAIIQHGTMTMVRRKVLEDVGGWGDWTITEDADLGLRIFAAGYEAVYSPRSYGRGVMPDTFVNYKKQRHRWAFGAMQILRRYRRELLGLRPSGLSAGQRYHFVAGWLPWLADGFNILFTMAALIWSAAMIWMPDRIDPPLAAFTILPVGLFLFKVFKLFYLYCTRIGEGCARSFSAALSGLALSHTIGRAVLSGMFTREAAFFRTPKLEGRSGFYQAWLSVREELLLLIALWSAALGISQLDVPVAWDLRLWIFALMIQSLPYLAAVVMGVISALPSTSVKDASKATVRQA